MYQGPTIVRDGKFKNMRVLNFYMVFNKLETTRSRSDWDASKFQKICLTIYVKIQGGFRLNKLIFIITGC